MLLASQCISQCVVFGDFRFNVPTRELLRVGNHGSVTPVTLGSRAADLLHLFLDRPGELISKSEIMDAVWPNIAVEESNLTVQISALRRALGGSRSGARYIQTVPGRGYRFTPWVDEFASPIDVAKPGTANPANGPDAIMFANGMGVLKTDAGPSRDSLIALPEIAPLSSPPPFAPLSPEPPAGVVQMPVSHAQTNVWWLSWLDGVAGIIVGLTLVTAPDITAVALISLLGLYWLLMGMLALVRVFVDQSVPWFWSLIIGIVGILTGIFVIRLLLVAALILPPTIIVVLGVQGLIVGGLEIFIGLIGAGSAPSILGTFHLLIGLFLLGSLVIGALAAPLAIGALFLLQGLTLTLFAFRARS
jgi:DNA-binding winged helix-turn-helix (wHTH) protein/uncharacterized membrane protein HdeD (DUF308 family)